MLEGVFDFGLVPVGANDSLSGNDKRLVLDLCVIGNKDAQTVHTFCEANLF